jgi:hypothetical protein
MLEVVLRASGAVSIDAASAMLRKEWRSLTKVRVVDDDETAWTRSI